MYIISIYLYIYTIYIIYIYIYVYIYIDFGSSCDDGPGWFTINGTLLYMTPEMIRMTGLGKSQDIYSLGILLFELLCGKKCLC